MVTAARPMGRIRSCRFALAALAAALLSGDAVAARAACDDILPGPVAPAARRAVTPEDIIRLRDIGQPDGALILPQSPLGVSPDGRQVAFVLTQADLATNGYCRALVVIGIEPGARPRIVDKGGELITVSEVRRGLVQRGGFPELIVPGWSPDGRWIANLRWTEASPRAWRACADGSGAVQVTRSPVDVEALAWSADGRRLIYSSRPGLLDQQRALEREGEGGFTLRRPVRASLGKPATAARRRPLRRVQRRPRLGQGRPRVKGRCRASRSRRRPLP